MDGLVAKVDYNTSAQFITVPAGTPAAKTIPVPVVVFDDIIDEADVEYFVLLLESNDPRVDLSHGRFASRGVIKDNESMSAHTILYSST